jgi:hypothetical protein
MGVSPVQSANEIEWEKIRPALDDAMHELKETDRDAILFRYFENRPFAEVGAKLGLNENAARMRVERALEKLRGIFAKRGVTTATALASVISANAVQIAPANLAATLTTASIATAGTGTFALLKIMTATKLKLAFSALIVAGAAMTFVIQHQAQENLRAESEMLRQQVAQLQTDNESLSNRLAAAADSKSLSAEQFNELLKLRGEVTRLQREQNVSLAAVKSETNNLQREEKTSIRVGTKFVIFPTEALQALGINWTSAAQDSRVGLLAEEQFKVINEALQGASDVKIINSPVAITGDGIKAQMSVSKPVPMGGTNANIGIQLGVTPYFSANSSTFNLLLFAELTQLAGDASQPDLQTIQITNQVNLLPGQTAVLAKEIPGDGWLSDATNTPAGPRSLLVFVTPTIVNSRDYQRNGMRVSAIWKSPTNMDSSDFPKSLQKPSLSPNQ